MVAQGEGSPKSVDVIPWGNFCGNPSNSCWDISVWTKVVDNFTKMWGKQCKKNHKVIYYKSYTVQHNKQDPVFISMCSSANV